MNRVLISRKDGGISIMEIIHGEFDEEINKWMEAHPEEYVSHSTIDSNSIPVDREYRDAWVPFKDSIGISCEKARDLALRELRLRREIKFKDMGVPYRLDGGLEEAFIDEEKRKKLKELRDITEILKGLEVEGKINDQYLLNVIQEQKKQPL